MSPGLFSSSARASAKLSPTQLYSGRLEVFSNGNTITTSALGFCENACVAGEIRAKTTKNAENNRNFKLQTPQKKLRGVTVAESCTSAYIGILMRFGGTGTRRATRDLSPFQGWRF